MKLGYIRVSTQSQNIDRQLDALHDAGCEKLFIDKITGAKADRPQLTKMFEQLRQGDIVIVTELSRFGRSTKDILVLVERIRDIGAEFKSLKDDIDTTTAIGQFFFIINCAFTQLQRDLIVINTKEGLESARTRGRKGGRPPVNEKALKQAIELYKSKSFTIKEIEETTKISKATLYRYLNKNNNVSQ